MKKLWSRLLCRFVFEHDWVWRNGKNEGEVLMVCKRCGLGDGEPYKLPGEKK